MRLRYPNAVGAFSRVAAAIAEAGGDIGAIDIVRASAGEMVRDVTVNAADDAHAARIVTAVEAVPGITVVNWSDRTFLLHLGGKIEVRGKVPLKTRDDLTMAYTPGVARVSRAIHEDPAKAYNLTIKGNTVAVVSDGTAVLGLGDIGPEAAMPVMEGKALLFKEFAGVDAFPICLNTRDTDEIVRTVAAIAPAFGGINLEDISAPRCFEIEERLQGMLDIPVFHDDQHGTAIVVLAALLNALQIVDKELAQLRVVVSGVGAAGVACARMLLAAGVRDVVGVDRAGALHPDRTDRMNPTKAWFAGATNPRRAKGTLVEVIEGADFFLGVSQGNILPAADVARMARDPIVFALANPTPEVAPEEAAPHVAVMATGRSDYPNQINNVLAFPGVFRGALDVRASAINEEMKMAAARALAGLVGSAELSREYIVPSVFDRRIAPAVAEAVAEAAERTGVARRTRRPTASVMPE
ncbi:MAG TPA: NAD-dependent malic enzyme [Chloroflexota bacterium]|jgi:malate dehydrogenase (oxaloacetate-decarboxylating)|nr:NAD-dependent malic enzyme [Chloroflexota bacterium]